MSRIGRSLHGILTLLVVWMVALVATTGVSSAADVELKDGRILQGRLGLLSSLADQPQAITPGGTGPLQLIVFLDDDLRRTFFPKHQILQVGNDDAGQIEEKFNIRQRVARSGRMVKSVGPAVRITPFDEFGRRTYEFNTVKGPIEVVQGITQITPKWTKVEGLKYI